MGHCRRLGHAMAYDSAREVAVLFGGQDYYTQQGFNRVGDTWDMASSPNQ